MAAIQQPNAAALDKAIQAYQSVLFTELLAVWNLQSADWLCYDRAYRNQGKDGYIPEVFVGSEGGEKSQDYKEVYFDDTVKVVSFFGLGENIKYDAGTATAPVYLIFAITNLPALRSGTKSRMDEQVRNDVQQFCQFGRYGFTMTGWALGIDNVFKEYTGWRKSEGIKYRDMHPGHCFRVNFDVVYNINEC